jgi:hypothetical protein
LRRSDSLSKTGGQNSLGFRIDYRKLQEGTSVVDHQDGG